LKLGLWRTGLTSLVVIGSFLKNMTFAYKVEMITIIYNVFELYDIGSFEKEESLKYIIWDVLTSFIKTSMITVPFFVHWFSHFKCLWSKSLHFEL